MKIGHLVAPTKDGKGSLRSGAEAWRVAVVVSVEPFVMVSEGATMKWSAQNPDDFDVVGMAQPGTINLAMTRMPPEDQIRMPVGESFLENQLGNGLTLIHRGLQPAAIDLVEKTPNGTENVSYGWVFVWNSDWGRWQALAKPEPEEFNEIMDRIRTGIVTDTEGNVQFQLKTAERQIEEQKYPNAGILLALGNREPGKQGDGNGGNMGVYRNHATGARMLSVGGGVFAGSGGGGQGAGQASYGAGGPVSPMAYSDKCWTVRVEDDGVTVQFIPSIQTQLVHSAGMHYLSRTIHSALQGKSPQEVGHEKIDEIVKHWFDDHVARGSIILPNKEKEE